MNTLHLPLNCEAEYISQFLTEEEAAKLYDTLIQTYNIDKPYSVVVHGVEHTLDSGKIMFIDQELYDAQAFSAIQHGKTAVWPEQLLPVRKKIEQLTGRKFGTGVCIYYPDGNVGVDYHSDFPAFGDTTVIPSLSLGEERLFYLREKQSQETFDLILEKGSLLIMGENCQERYEHSLPSDPRYKQGRINITFRQVGF